MNKKTQLIYQTPNLQLSAQKLADKLDMVCTSPMGTSTPSEYWLELTESGLQLYSNLLNKSKPIMVDFLTGSNFHRYRFGGGKSQMIAKAVGMKSLHNPTILDITAGLGGDGFVLATLGGRIQMIERSAVLFALLDDGILRAKQEPWFRELHLTIQHADARCFLQKLDNQHMPDVIYYDPMFPCSEKTALVKKEMRILRQVVGDDHDSQTVLPLCIEKAKKRVVVKRPYHAPCINHIKPDLQYKGKSSRFDVYLTHNLSRK